MKNLLVIRVSVQASFLVMCLQSKALPIEDPITLPLSVTTATVFDKENIFQSECHPDKLILPEAVKEQTRSLTMYLATKALYDQEKLNAYWQKVDEQQTFLIKASEDYNLSIDNFSVQGLLPYLLEQQMPDEYQVLVNHGMPENRVNDLTINQWMKRLKNPLISGSGELICCRKFADLDTGWLLSGINYASQITGLMKKTPFNTTPGSALLTGDQLKLVLIGDWGTNTPSAQAVMEAVKQEDADIVIHLGDVYYSGTQKEEERNFLPGFQSGIKKALMLNSNHEMDGAAKGYFYALKNPIFSLQQNSSFFAFEYGDWVIIGLDSAYYSDGVLYNPGRIIDEHQRKLLSSYQNKSSRLIVLSHHNPINTEGNEPEQLWKDVIDALGGATPAYWYFGHKHAGVMYSELSYAGQHHTKARCVGHSGMPIGKGSDYFDNDGGLLENILFYAHTPDPKNPPQVTNGYMVLTIKGEEIMEEYYDQNRERQWPIDTIEATSTLPTTISSYH